VKRRQQPTLITDAERSPDDQLRSRQIRYITMMSVRAVCLVVAAVLVSSDAPLLWLWVPMCVVGMVLLPWLAVIIANDRPPKEKYRLSNRLRHATTERGPQALPTQATKPAAEEERASRTIDAEW
jgi:Flp pilus assembly protein TadB